MCATAHGGVCIATLFRDYTRPLPT